MQSRAQKQGELEWSKGLGLNSYDPADKLLPGQLADAVNIVFEDAGLFKKRAGHRLLSFSIAGGFSGVNQLGFYSGALSISPGAENFFFWTDRGGTTKCLVADNSGGVGTGVSLSRIDNFSDPINVSFCQFNTKMYVAYDSAVNRLHVVDPNISATTLRRTGLAVPAAPTVANTGAGAYPATARQYRVRWQTVVSGPRVQRQSEAGPALAFTPSGAGTAARVTQPTPPGEGETHWLVEASVDGLAWYELSQIVIATTTYDDSALVATYASNTAAEPAGAFTNWPSVKYLLADADRLLGFGSWEPNTDSFTRSGRVYFSPVLDTTNTDDDERVSNSITTKGWIDVGRGIGGTDTGIAGPVNGVILVFQTRGIYMLERTGNADTPYVRSTLTTTVGAIPDTITVGVDEAGNPCVYFLDYNLGPCRYGPGGLQWCGYDVQSIWATYNRFATIKSAWGRYNPSNKCVKWHIATGSANEPDMAIRFNTRLGQNMGPDGVRFGWSRENGDDSETRCGVVGLVGVTYSQSFEYVGTDGTVMECERPAVELTARAYGTSAVLPLTPKHNIKKSGGSWLMAHVSEGVVIRETVTLDYGRATRTNEVELTAIVNEQYGGAPSRVLRRFNDHAFADAYAVQVTLGDPSDIASAWNIISYLSEQESTAGPCHDR